MTKKFPAPSSNEPPPHSDQTVLQWIEMLEHEDMATVAEALWNLRDLGDPRAVSRLINLLALQGISKGGVVYLALQALLSIGEPAFRPLLAALNDDEPAKRAAAAWALAEFGDRRAVEPLITALADDDDRVRTSAARALGEIADPRAREPLIVAMGDGYPGVREAAAVTLGLTGDQRAVEPLIAVLKSSTSWPLECYGAVRALGRIGDPRAVGPLIAALNHRDKTVRRLAMDSLRSIGTPEAIAAADEAARHNQG